jgi:hypothetical protein
MGVRHMVWLLPTNWIGLRAGLLFCNRQRASWLLVAALLAQIHECNRFALWRQGNGAVAVALADNAHLWMPSVQR